MLRTALIIGAAAMLVAPAAAQAHVTLQPNTAAAGGYTRLDVRVPNERDDASTTKVEVQFPDGFQSASYEPIPGWSAKVTTGKLETPIETDDGQVTEGVKTITWTADDAGDAIPPGAFQDFGLSLRIPDKAGEKLTFKALQTYSDGNVVRWIDEPTTDGTEPESPAPVLKLTAAGAAEDVPAAGPSVAAEADDAAASEESDSGSGSAFGIAGLVAGLAGLVLGLLEYRKAAQKA